MSERYSASGLEQFAIEVGPNELVRGATWVRSDGQIVTPVSPVDLYIAESCEIVQIVILTYGGPASCVIDIWRDTFANFPPTVADTIFAIGKPTISGGTDYSDTVLAGVSVGCNAGEVLRFNLDSSAAFTRISIFLVLRKD